MIEAAKSSFGERWPEIREHTKTELKGLAEGIAMIERLRLSGQISQAQAKALMKMKRNTAQIILLTIQGLHAVMVEQAINAAIASVRQSVNTALDFRLL